MAALRTRPYRLLQLSVPALHALRVYAAPLSIMDDEPDTPPGSEAFYWKLGLSVVLVLLGGIFAGLTLGLMGLDLVNLQVLSTSGEKKERKDAVKVMKLLEKGRHWVLVVLLLSNVVVNESLPIFLDSILGGGVGAIVLSTTLIFVFGEIIPQSVCARYGIRIGAKAAPFVLALMYLEAPIAWPLAKLLDYLLGEEQGVTYKKAELKTFVGLHKQFGEETLNDDEVTIISSVLELGDKSVKDIMTPLEDIYSLPSDTKLSHAIVDQILASGHSRIPVHVPGNPTDFLGMLIVKKLISYDPEDEKQLGDFALSVLPETGPDSTCLDVLNYFQQGRSHILLVSSTPGEPGGAMGVVSLEDVIEEMIGEEIVDETDLYIDIHAKTKVVRAPSRKPASGGKLAPLIAGIIERRRQARRQNTAEFPAANGIPDSPMLTDRPNTPAGHTSSGFDKVRLRGGGVPERRLLGGSGYGTPSAAGSISPDPNVRGRSGGANTAAEERTPLLAAGGTK